MTDVVAAGADEVSVAVTELFSQQAQAYQAVLTHAAAFHTEFVKALSAGAGSYASTEAANASSLQALEQDLPRRQCAHRGAVGAAADRQRRQRGHR